jgi:hypothetical protein
MTYAGVPFLNSIEGGGNLIIPFLQSPNFIPGVSGWRISRNGDVEFGSGTFRGPLIVINPLTGLVVASISNTGNIAGQYASIENDIILAGQSLGDRLSDGRGLVAFKGTFATPPAPGNSGAYTDTAWFRAPMQTDRVYFVSCTPLGINNNSISGSRGFRSRWSYTDTGGGSAIIQEASVTVGQTTFNPVAYVAQGALFSIGPTPDVTATWQLQSTQSASGNLTFSNVGGWNMYCWDIGTFAGAMNDGDVGTNTGASQRTTQYNSTLSQSYDGSGNQFVSTDLWRGDFGDGKGDTRSLCIFPGATMRTDFGSGSGATIQSATLTMFCTTAADPNGSLGFEGATNTTIPATLAAGSVDYGFDDDWPNPGWFTVNILGDFLDDIIAGDNAMHIVPPGFFGNAQTRFAGASVANRPYITVTYTK